MKRNSIFTDIYNSRDIYSFNINFCFQVYIHKMTNRYEFRQNIWSSPKVPRRYVYNFIIQHIRKLMFARFLSLILQVFLPYFWHYILSQNFVPSFCFHHFLRNISIVINTFAPKLHSFTRMKKSRLSVLKRPIYRFRFQCSTKNRKSTGMLHRNNRKVPRMLTLKKCARCPEYFQIKKRC